MILIDTHPIIWFSIGDNRLGSQAHRQITDGFDTGAAIMSPISFWETAMLTEKGRVTLEAPVRIWADILFSYGLKIAELSPDIAIEAGQLTGDIHGDPADRVIVATARLLRCPLLTADRKLLAYAAAGHLQAVDARL